MNFFNKLLFKKKSIDNTQSDIISWLKEKQSEIFIPGDIEFSNDSIQWIAGEKKVVKIKWEDISNLYIAKEKGINNIYIEDVSQQKIKFYISNKSQTRDRLYAKLIQFAKLKGSKILI